MKRVAHPVLGELTRSRGRWRGSVALRQCGVVPLALPGSRRGPDPDALALALSVQLELDRCEAAIQEALIEHGAAYGVEVAAKAAPSYASVVTLDGRPALEVGYHVPWDDEHTLGARLRDGQLLELSGSVLET